MQSDKEYMYAELVRRRRELAAAEEARDFAFGTWLKLSKQRDAIVHAANLAGVPVYIDPASDGYRMRQVIADAMSVQWRDYLYASSVLKNANRAERAAYNRWSEGVRHD